MALEFKERSRERPPFGRFGVAEAEYNRTYVLDDMHPDGSSHPVTSQALYDRILLVIGTTRPGPAAGGLGAPGGAGSLVRVMPMADPQFPGLFADVPAVRVNDMEGYVDDQYGLGGLLAVPPIVPGFSRFNAWEFDVPFTPRPYAVLPNERMTSQAVYFYNEYDVKKRLTYYPEWLRYVQTFVDDVDSRLSASVASSMVYRIPSGDPAGVDGTTYTGIPDMLIPDQKYVLRWFQVPLRYLTSRNSFLVKYKGYVNQLEFLNKPVSSLLYLGAKVVRTYTPPQFLPTQQPASVEGFVGVLTGSFYAEPLVDVELTFIYTARAAAPGDAVPAVERPNRNWTDGGHQLMPHFASKRFFYGHSKTDPPDAYALWTPSYLSVPHQILFQDPDVVGVVIDG